MKKATRADVQAAFAELDAQPAAEVEAQRKRNFAAYKSDRGRLSDGELMFESLADLFGFDSEEREALHLFTARAMDKSPDDPLIFNEVDIGRQLDGDDDVTLEAFKRRTVRVVERLTLRAARHGKAVIERIPGKWSLGAGKDSEGRKAAAREEKKVGARYRYHWPQAVAEGVEIARGLRAGNRRGRFRRAAEVIFESDLFPKCAPPRPVAVTPTVRDAEEVRADVSPAETFEHVTGEQAPPELPRQREDRVSPLRIPRTVRRMKDNAALALRAAKERDERSGGGSREFNRQAAWLAVELVRTIEREQGGEDLRTGDAIRQAIALLEAVAADPAELSCIDASLDTLEANTKQDSAAGSENSADLMGGSSERVSQNSGRKRENAPDIQDSAVQKNRGAGLIPEAVKEEVRASADLVQIAERRGVKLKRAGSEWKGCCPFHEERTASFSVNPSKGVYKCFGCGASGDVFKFVSEIDRVNFREAVVIVAGESGVALPDEVVTPKPKAERAPRELRYEPDPPPGYQELEL